MEVSKIKADDVETLLMEEYINNSGGSAYNYEQWKNDNERIINLFCGAMEKGNEGELNICFGETNKKLLEAFLLVSVRTRQSYGTKKLAGNRYIGKKVISKGLRYLIEDRWLEGINLFYYNLYLKNDYERVISDGCKKIVKEKWLEAFKIIWEKKFMNLNTLARFALKERWTDAIKYIIYFYEKKNDKSCRNKWDWNIPIGALLEDCKTSDLKFLLENDLYKIEHIGESVVSNNWKEGVNLLIKRGADSRYLFECAVSSKWMEGIEMLLDKIGPCDNVICGRIYEAVIEKRRYDLLEKCLHKWGNLESIDLSICSDIRAVMDVVEIAERYNYDGHNWIAGTDALYKWCDKYISSPFLPEESLERWKHLTSIDLSWCSDIKIVDTIRQMAEKIKCNENEYIEEINDLEEWRCKAERKLAAEFLLRHGADVNRYGETVKTYLLHHCALKGTDMIEFLVSKGADVNAKDFNGQTPLLYILGKGGGGSNSDIKEDYLAEDIIKAYYCLVKHGADEMIADSDGNTARELLEPWKKRCERYDEYFANQIEAEVEAYEKRINDRNYGVLESLSVQYGGDEDAMHSDPDYWDYMYGLTDDE